MAIKNKLSPVEQAKLKKILDDPVLWAKAFIVANNPVTKRMEPWIARDYQEDMLRCKDLRVVYRLGRRLGKTEVLCIGGLNKAYTHKNYRILYVTPYESQVNLIFKRLRELIAYSPLVKMEVVRMKNSPYQIDFKNGSSILGFTTGASSGSGAASVRGQRADWLYLDELDYMGSEDYSTISMIANERADIGMTASSTPTGKRGIFYRMCTDPSFGYTQFYHDSFANPNYTKEMDERNKVELTQSQYDHEILAVFGTEESGVFNKDKLDLAMKQELYAYEPLTNIQMRNLESSEKPEMMIYDEENRAPKNLLRCVGIDFDKYQAGSSIVVLDFDINKRKFRVIKRIEVPRGEYSLDNAVNWIIKVNKIYDPSWIYVDRGYGDYQLERLHMYGDSHPSSGLKNKVVGWQFKNTIDVVDPITKELHKEPMKQFMVNQLSLTIDRGNLILSPFDEVLHKQLTDYEVDHVSQTGLPVYTSVNEHFVDALGLAHLAFVLKFPDIAGIIKAPKLESKVVGMPQHLGAERAIADLKRLSSPINPWNSDREENPWQKLPGWDSDSRKYSVTSPNKSSDYGYWTKVPLVGRSSRATSSSWGSRGGGFEGRSSW